MSEKNVRFARIRGKIIPIKVKKGSGSRKPEKIRAKRDPRADKIKKEGFGGTELLSGIGIGIAGSKLFESGKKDALKSVLSAKVAVGTGRKEFADHAVKLFKRQKLKHSVGSKMAMLGLGLAGAGFVKAYFQGKKAKKLGTERMVKTKALRKSYREQLKKGSSV